MFEIIVEKEGMELLRLAEGAGVPRRFWAIGRRDCMPAIVQGFVKKPENVASGLEFDRKLYIVRRRIFEQSNDNTYVCLCSSRHGRV